MKSLKETYKDQVVSQLQSKFNYSNVHQIPKMVKVILHRGLGESVNNSKVVEETVVQFADITGQKPVVTKAKKAISNFKLRLGQPIGCKVTLRSDKMYDFVTKLLNIVLPKIRDFRGVSVSGFDGRGNYTLGLKEDIIFPEVKYEKAEKVRGMDITFVTTAESDEEAFELLKLVGMPFSRKTFKGEVNG